MRCLPYKISNLYDKENRVKCQQENKKQARRCFKNGNVLRKRKENVGMTSCYDKFTFFGHICTFSRNRITVRRLPQGGISDSGYFFYQFVSRKGRSQFTKVTESSISMDSAGNHVLFQGVWRDMASDIAAALREIYWTASKNLTLL